MIILQSEKGPFFGQKKPQQMKERKKYLPKRRNINIKIACRACLSCPNQTGRRKLDLMIIRCPRKCGKSRDTIHAVEETNKKKPIIPAHTAY